MKGVVVSVILMVSVIVIMIFSWTGIEKVGADMCGRVDQIKEDVSEGRWEDAKKHTDNLQKQWEKDTKWIAIFIDHRETDEIVKSLYALKEYIKYEEIPELMATAAALRELFEHMPRKERPLLENIL